MTRELTVAVVILTYNEEKHLARALKSVASFATQIFVIDSFSTDATPNIAVNNGAILIQNQFINYAKAIPMAIDNASISADWIMRLDADEIIEQNLALEISKKLLTLPREIVGINLKRKHIFMDRWVRHGGRYPLNLLRIWRFGHGRIEHRWMDEHIVVWGGGVVTFNGGFLDHNLNDLSFFIDKHNRYATREALDVLNQKLNLFEKDDGLNVKSASFQVAFKRWCKESIYNRLPFTVSVPVYFFWRYIIQLGFLDGRTGLIYHFLQGFWYRFLVGAKIKELEDAISEISDKEEIRTRIKVLTGYDLR